ncbi:hypothetical protein BGZ98_001921 [Dissophora globulifera]|nr:hypothetical protein BGZ98_001921 [Dissophora globulifera]
MAAVSEFSTKVSQQVSQRLHSQISPLTEANLYRHTITSPASREAKLKHILSYVEMQRELVALEEEMFRSATEKGRWRNTLSTNPSKSDLALELHNSQPVPSQPVPSQPSHYRHLYQQKQQDHLEEHPNRHQHKSSLLPQEPPQPIHRPSTKQFTLHQTPQLPSTPAPASALAPIYAPVPPSVPHSPPAPSSTPYQTQRYYGQPPRNIDHIPDGLDPAMALPRALPRSMARRDQTLYRDSFYSGIGNDNDWRHLDELDPVSLAGIYVSGDNSQLQQHRLQLQPSLTSPFTPAIKDSTYDYAAISTKNTEWQQSRHQPALRESEYPDEDDQEFGAEIAARQRLQVSISQARHQQLQEQHQQAAPTQRQQPRQLVSPALTFVEKEKKGARFSSRFSFMRGRKNQHQRHESLPTATNDAWSPSTNAAFARAHSLSVRPGNQPPTAIGLEDHQGPEGTNVNSGVSKPILRTKDNNNRVRRMFKDVFNMGSKKKDCRSPESPFRDISLPSTHIRATMTPSPQPHHQHLDLSTQDHYRTAMAQRKGLVTPVSRPATSQSNHHNNDSKHYDNNNGREPRNRRESLVDPIQTLNIQKMDLENGDDFGFPGQDVFDAVESPFAQASLTPPPASSVLRHSTSSHRVFHTGIGDYEPILISAIAVGAAAEQYESHDFNTNAGGQPRTRPSSQLMPVPKDLVDSGCDSMGGHEQYATMSNATTLNHSNQCHSQSHQQQPQHQSSKSNQIHYQQQQQQVPALPIYDYTRGITMSTYDNGPTIVSMGQVQKVDLEGLRQNHQHHSPPTHSHHLGMVAIESAFA